MVIVPDISLDVSVFTLLYFPIDDIFKLFDCDNTLKSVSNPSTEHKCNNN